MSTKKRATSLRLSEDVRALMTRLAERHGVSETDVLEMAVRRMARVDLAEGSWPPLAVLDAAAAVLGKRRGD